MHCIHCGNEIDTGSIGLDEPDGELFIVLTARQGFRESSTGKRLHPNCYKELFGEPMPVPEWAGD